MNILRFLTQSRSTAPPELVLAYLEQIQRDHTLCYAVDIKDRETPVSVAKMDESGVHLVLEGPIVVRRGGPVRLRCYLDNLRFELKTVVLALQEDVLHVQVPHSLLLDERRLVPRAALGPHEKAHAMLLTGLFEGKAVSGFLDNVSVSGARIQLVQALSIKRQTPIPLVEDILLPKEDLAVIRLEGLQRCPTIEIPGVVVYHEIQASKLYLGVSFAHGYEDRLPALKAFVDSRADPIPHAVPKKERLTQAAARPAPPTPVLTPAPQKTHFARLSVGPEYCLRIRAEGQEFGGLALSEISAGGCSWRADRNHHGALEAGTILKSIVIEHPDLPATELAGRVVESTPSDSGDAFLVEVEFSDLDPRIRHAIDQHVLHQLTKRSSQRSQAADAVQQEYPTLSLEGDFTVCFRHHGKAYTAIRMAEISAAGCLLHLPKEIGKAFQPGSLLAIFKFDHPDLPTIPIQAQVTQLVPMGLLMALKVAFVNLNSRVQSSIHIYVMNQMGCLPEEEKGPKGLSVSVHEKHGDHRTLRVGPEYSCRFKINGLVYQDIALTDISADGCGFRVDVRRSGPFQVGVVIQLFHLDHAELPQVPMQGCISRILGKLPGRTEGYILVHMDFLNINERLVNVLEEHVDRCLRGDL